MTNFDFLKTEPRFVSFADAAIAAEQTYRISPVLSVLGCRQAMETAIKWKGCYVGRKWFCQRVL